MASFVYHRALAKLLSGDLDLNTHDIRMALVMTNTDADTNTDAEFIASFASLDEMDGANYVRKALANETVTADLTNDRGEFTADAVTWSALGNGTRQLEGIVLFRHVTNDADSIPIAFIDPPGWPLNPGGADLTVTPNAEGILQLANA
jgi:hypothetical protein